MSLDTLVQLLKKEPLTAKQIAREMKCSAPTAYARLRRLIDAGEQLYTIRAKSKRPGPRATLYGIR